MKPLIIFDFFGVISSEIAPVWLKKHFKKEEIDKIKQEILEQADFGQISFYEMLNLFAKKTKMKPEHIEKEWHNLVKINQELINVIKFLKTKNFIALLSNSSSEFLRKILKQHNLCPLFDEIIISSEVKMAKPQIEIYDKMLKLFKNKYSKVCFIDDNINNIYPVENLHIHGILFKNNQQIADELKKFLEK